MIPTSLKSVVLEGPAGQEYWPSNDRAKFVEHFNALIFQGVQGYDIKTIDRLVLRYDTSTQVDQFTKVRYGFVRHWFEQINARPCQAHPLDRDLEQFAIKAEINDVICYVYPVGRIKRFKYYDEVEFSVTSAVLWNTP